jgi:hypothetical protein
MYDLRPRTSVPDFYAAAVRALIATGTSSAVHLELWMARTASSAVSFPICNASFGSLVIKIGMQSSLRTYREASAPERLTRTTNFVFAI